MEATRKSVLYVHNSATTFVKIDRAILAEEWDVVEWYQQSRWFNMPRLWLAVRSSNLVFCWFASWHSLFPVLFAKLLGVRVIAVVGGYDTARVPEAGYGSMRGGLVRRVARTIIRHSDLLVTFSRFSASEVIRNGGASEEKVVVIYLGIPEREPGSWHERNCRAITVGGVWRENLHRKGLYPFVCAGHLLPEFELEVVGKWYDDSIDDLRRAASPNVRFTGFVTDGELDHCYKSSSVYVQPSLHEGFGMSVAEGMLAGCIPVVTRNGALPEVVGETGVYLDSVAPPVVAAAIRSAHGFGEIARRAARQRILDEFPLDRRRRELKRVVRELIG